MFQVVNCFGIGLPLNAYIGTSAVEDVVHLQVFEKDSVAYLALPSCPLPQAAKRIGPTLCMICQLSSLIKL